jgi:hypothetical protein
MPRYAWNKSPARVKRLYFELIRQGLSGAAASERVGVSLSCDSVWFIDATGLTAPSGRLPDCLGRVHTAAGQVRPVARTSAILQEPGRRTRPCCRDDICRLRRCGTNTSRLGYPDVCVADFAGAPCGPPDQVERNRPFGAGVDTGRTSSFHPPRSDHGEQRCDQQFRGCPDAGVHQTPPVDGRRCRRVVGRLQAGLPAGREHTDRGRHQQARPPTAATTPR